MSERSDTKIRDHTHLDRTNIFSEIAESHQYESTHLYESTIY